MVRVTATEAARNFADLLNRARYGNESFVVVRNGEEVARILPPERPESTLGDLLAVLGRTPVDEDFLADLEDIRASVGPAKDRWGS